MIVVDLMHSVTYAVKSVQFLEAEKNGEAVWVALNDLSVRSTYVQSTFLRQEEILPELL